MTAATDAKLIVETLIGRTITVAKLVVVVRNFIRANAEPTDADVDFTAMTNEQTAALFLFRLKTNIRNSVQRGASLNFQETNASLQETAVSDSVVDL